MKAWEYFRHFGRSPLGVICAAVSLAAGLGLGAATGSPALGAAATAAVYAAALAIGAATGAGAAAVAREAERVAASSAAERLANLAESRERLRSLRLGEEELARARDLVVLEADRLAEACGRAKTWDPQGAAAAGEALELVGAYLRERDESAVERRFDRPDANLFPEALGRTVEALKTKAILIAARRDEIARLHLGEIPAQDRMSIEEELR